MKQLETGSWRTLTGKNQPRHGGNEELDARISRTGLGDGCWKRARVRSWSAAHATSPPLTFAATLLNAD